MNGGLAGPHRPQKPALAVAEKLDSGPFVVVPDLSGENTVPAGVGPFRQEKVDRRDQINRCNRL